MGQKCCAQTPLKKEELDEYELLTYLTRTEIIQAFREFSKLNPTAIEHNKDSRLLINNVVTGTPVLAQNPFGDRICAAFSSEKDGKMSFDDYLDMYSVMSARGSHDMKTHFAFLAYDFDNDGVIGKSDLGKIIDRVYHTDEKHLTNDEKKKIIARLLEEVDVDKDGFICKPEFKFAIAKCPDFFHSFKMYLA